MSFKHFCLCMVLLCSSLSFAQYSDEQLYQAYLNRDMNIWEEFITKADWPHLSNPEKLRVLHYQFGLTAYVLSIQQPNARELLDLYEQHLAEMEPCLSKGMFLMYDGAAHSYELSYKRSQVLKQGPMIYDCLDRAVEMEPNNPIILTMRGQVDLYNPLGNNKKAYTYLQKADSLYHLPNRPYYQWNIRAEQIALLTCMVRVGEKKQAVQRAHAILQKEEPNFHWIRNTFLPENE